MKNIVYVLLLLIGFANTGFAQDSEKRVAPLQDAEKPYVTVFVPSTDHDVARWFTQNERLAKSVKHTHFKVITGDDPMYVRYAKTVPTLPAVTVQNHKGEVLYKATRENIPNNPSALASKIEKCCPWRDRNPEPEPEPEPDPVDPQPEPDVPDTDPVPDSGINLWLALASLVGGAAVGAGAKYRDTYK